MELANQRKPDQVVIRDTLASVRLKLSSLTQR